MENGLKILMNAYWGSNGWKSGDVSKYDEIFLNDKPADPGKPYHEYDKKDIEEFVKKQSAICRRIMSKYAGKNGELQNNVLKNAFEIEYGSCKGNTLNRGIYHAGEATEIIVANVGRGSKLKRPPKSGRYYRYIFDENKNLICAEIIDNDDVEEQEFIVREDGAEYGLIFSYNGAVRNIYTDAYKNGHLDFTYLYGDTVENLCLYEYDESGRRSAATVFLNDACSIYSEKIVLRYEYNENGELIGARDDGYFYSVRGKNARKYITAAKVTEAMQTIIFGWNELLSDVYALSVYFEDNAADDKTQMYLGYNTEENFRANISSAHDEREARWNYAFWLQNNKPLFGDTVYVRYIESGGSGYLLANAVKRLHKSGVITEKFGKELPVIIHELEYYPEIAVFNIEGNGKRLTPKDFIDFCGGQ